MARGRGRGRVKVRGRSGKYIPISRNYVYRNDDAKHTQAQSVTNPPVVTLSQLAEAPVATPAPLSTAAQLQKTFDVFAVKSRQRFQDISNPVRAWNKNQSPVLPSNENDGIMDDLLNLTRTQEAYREKLTELKNIEKNVEAAANSAQKESDADLQEIKNLVTTIQKLEVEHGVLEQNHSQQIQKCIALEKVIEGLRKEIADQKTQQDELKKQLASKTELAEQHSKQCNVLTNEIANLKTKLSEQTQQQSELKRKLEQHEKERGDLIATAAANKQATDALAKKTVSQSKRIQELETTQKVQLDKIAAQTAQLTQAEKDAIEQKKQLAQARNETSTVRNNLQTLAKRRKEQAEKLEQIHSVSKEKEKNHTDSENRHLDMIKKLQEQLKKSVEELTNAHKAHRDTYAHYVKVTMDLKQALLLKIFIEGYSVQRLDRESIAEYGVHILELDSNTLCFITTNALKEEMERVDPDSTEFEFQPRAELLSLKGEPHQKHVVVGLPNEALIMLVNTKVDVLNIEVDNLCTQSGVAFLPTPERAFPRFAPLKEVQEILKSYPFAAPIAVYFFNDDACQVNKISVLLQCEKETFDLKSKTEGKKQDQAASPASKGIFSGSKAYSVKYLSGDRICVSFQPSAPMNLRQIPEPPAAKKALPTLTLPPPALQSGNSLIQAGETLLPRAPERPAPSNVLIQHGNNPPVASPSPRRA